MIASTIDSVLGLPPVLLLGGGLLLLLLGATWLVDGAVALAKALGIAPLFIGLTIVACGTSAPELVVNIVAVWNGNPDLSFGNVIGSNIANIGLVVGVGALVAPLNVHGRIIGRELPWMIGASLLAIGLAYLPATTSGPGFDRVDGGVLLCSFVAFMVLWYVASRREGRDPLAQEVTEEAARHRLGSPRLAGLVLLIGLVLLLVGGKLTEHGAVELAKRVGMEQAVIGMTVVAIATSLPELATVVVAARRRHTDLALGNVIGSNIFNILLVLGASSIVIGLGPSGLSRISVPRPGGLADLSVALLLSVLLLVVAHTHRRVVNRLEGGLLLMIYVGYMAWRVAGEAWL